MNNAARQQFQAEVENLVAMRHFVDGAALQRGGDPEAVGNMVLAMNEAATNTILHGYQGQPGVIEIEVAFEEDALVVSLRDQSPAFDPTSILTPDLELPLPKRPFGGMGIHMMRQLTDELIYRTSAEWKNELILVIKEARK